MTRVAVVELEIPARPAYLSLVRLVVDAAVGSLAPGLSPARVDDLKIAVTEACANAIEAHETTDADGPVVVRCLVDDDHVTVEVVDRGQLGGAVIGSVHPGGHRTISASGIPIGGATGPEAGSR